MSTKESFQILETPKLEKSETSIFLTIRNMGHVPSFKNQKRAIVQRNGQTKIVTTKRVKKWMKAATESLFLQLLSESQTRVCATLTARKARHLIASLVPGDDSSKWISESHIKVVEVPKGEEGVDILIERIDEAKLTTTDPTPQTNKDTNMSSQKSLPPAPASSKQSSTTDLPAKLKASRKKRGWSQEILADCLGISVRTVQEWEQGRRTPRGLTLCVLVDKLDAL